MTALIALAACKKDLPETTPHPASAASALLAHVPADTPYLVAALDSIPPELWAWSKQAFGPALEGIWNEAARKQRRNDKVFEAIVSELDGKWSEAGFESLGFSARPRFVVYGLGLQPAVLRLAVKDDKVAHATIERIAAKAGKALPPTVTAAGRSYWQHVDKDGTTGVISLANNELVVAIGSSAEVQAKIGLILGSENPARNLGDGAMVKELMARHNFGGPFIAFADARRIAGKALEVAVGPPSSACNTALDRVAGKVPRLVFGYGEMSTSRVSGAVVAELSPDAVTALRALRTEVPGLNQALSEPSLMTLGGGLDLTKAQQLGLVVAGELKQLGDACQLSSLASGASEVSRALSQPLPEPFGRISGAAFVADDVVFSSGSDAKPEKVDGIALIASPDARALFDQALKLQPLLSILGIIPDGALHDVSVPVPLPFALSAGVGDRLIVVAAGDKRRASAEKLLTARGGGPVPLLALSYDFSKFLALMEAQGKLGVDKLGAHLAMFKAMGRAFGRITGALEITDHGLAYWATAELRPIAAVQQRAQ